MALRVTPARRPTTRTCLRRTIKRCLRRITGLEYEVDYARTLRERNFLRAALRRADQLIDYWQQRCQAAEQTIADYQADSRSAWS